MTAPPGTGGGGTSTGGGGPTGGSDPSTEGGLLAPFSPRVAYEYARVGARTRLTASTIRQLPQDAKIELRCVGGKSKGCAFKRKAIRHRGGDVKLAKVLRKLKLKARAAIELRITAAAGQVKVLRYVIRRGKSPKTSVKCAAPGGAPGACR